MKSKLNNMAFNKITMTIFTVLALLVPMFNYAFRFGYVYIDNSLFKGFSLSLFIIMILNAVLMFSLVTIKVKKSSLANKSGYNVLYLISLLLTIVFSIVILVNMIVSGSESIMVAKWMLRDIFPLWAVIVLASTLLFLFPGIQSAKGKKAVLIVATICLSAVLISSLFPVTPYKFTAKPTVFDNGQGYSVVFSTNDEGTAYVEYQYGGEAYKRYDEDNGRKTANSLIHTIEVPYEHLNNNTYKVGSMRVIDELSYGGRSGKTIETEAINFKGCYSDKIEVLTISDWHTYTDLAKQSISKMGSYDAVIMLGDAVPGLMCEEEIVRNILAFGGDITNGTMPVIFARGNHETRGKMAGELSGYLGMDKFYFKTSLGKYDLIVLDSGEDKKDDHSEYGGMVNYEQFRKDMVSWLNEIPNNDDKKTIALSHSSEICIEEDLAKSAKSKLKNLNASLLVSGHTHKCEFEEDGVLPILTDGGKSKIDGKLGYIATKLTLSNENILIASYDNNGNKVMDKAVNWK